MVARCHASASAGPNVVVYSGACECECSVWVLVVVKGLNKPCRWWSPATTARRSTVHDGGVAQRGTEATKGSIGCRRGSRNSPASLIDPKCSKEGGKVEQLLWRRRIPIWG